ncbi:uncharacterized protein [Procambarus clarkii]|uniref:uncharacterized protein n=1 Tax=Procambarus clarkii TaxID=6728 RepID=UPI001E6701F9|nr:uncharacterized protein LOC123762696 [Procambarus clarkii]
MMRTSTTPLLFLQTLLSSTILVATFEIQHDCLVLNNIETNITFDTFEFLSLARPEEHTVTAYIFCEDTNKYDYLNLTPSNVSLLRYRSNNQEDFITPTPVEVIGWTRFRLGFMNNLTLHDDNNLNWLHDPSPIDCTVSKLSIKNGNFTRQCSPNTPVWRIEGSQVVDVLMNTDAADLEKRINLTLFSMKNHKPFFNVCGAEFQLGLREGSMVMASDEAADALPPGRRYLALTILSQDSHTLLKVESEGDELLTTKVACYPSKVRVRGRNSDSFLLVEHLHIPTREEKELWCVSRSVAVGTSITAGVTILLLALMTFFVIYKYGREKTINRHIPPRPIMTLTSMPSYVEPIEPTKTATLERETKAKDRINTPSPEHLYEEIDESNIKADPHHHYTNEHNSTGSDVSHSSFRSSTSSPDIS